MRLLFGFALCTLLWECNGLSEPVYMKLPTAEEFNDFLHSGHDVKVVYFYRRDFTAIKKFLTEMEKSAAVMELYGAEFAILDCNKYVSVGYCDQEDSYERVYVYRKGHMMIDVSRNAMFDVNSIVANVLQIILLMEIPIMQSLPEFEQLQSSSKGKFDVIFSYQKAFGTTAHRIFLEVVFAHRTKYRYGITTEQAVVQSLRGYSSNEESGIWLLRCKEVTDQNQLCPVVKYTRAMVLDSVAHFFRVLDLTFIHYIGEDGDYNPFEDNNIHTVFIFYERNSKQEAKNIAEELIGVFLTQLGVIMVNVDEVNAKKFGYQTNWVLPTITFKPAGQEARYHMETDNTPVRFIAEIIGPIVPASRVDAESSETSSERVISQFDDMEKQDDEVAAVGTSFKKAMSMNKAHYFADLTSQTYYTAVNSNHIRRPLMVLYYISFDARCQVFLSTFDEVAHEMASNDFISMAAINCYDWTDVCQQANVSVYPTVRVFHDASGHSSDYKGLLSKETVVQVLKLYTFDAPDMLRSVEEFDEFLSATDFDVVIFGGFLDEDEKAMAAFKLAAVHFRGELLLSQMIGQSSDYGCSKFKTKPPCTVVIRRHDILKPFTVLPMYESSDDLISSINQAKLELFPELTVGNFPLYKNRGLSFVIVFVNGKQLTINSDLMSTVATLVRKKELSDDAVYAWMDVSKSEAARQILQHYVDQPLLHELLVINHSKGTVYRFTGTVSEQTVRHWITAALSGDIPASKFIIVKDWRPNVKPFDFLAKIDSELSGQGVQSDRANEDEDEASPFQLLDSDIEKALKEEKSRLMRAQLLYQTEPLDESKSSNTHDEF